MYAIDPIQDPVNGYALPPILSMGANQVDPNEACEESCLSQELQDAMLELAELLETTG